MLKSEQEMKKTAPTSSLMNFVTSCFPCLFSLFCNVTMMPVCPGNNGHIYFSFLIRLSVTTPGSIPHAPNGWLCAPLPSRGLWGTWSSRPTCRIPYGLPTQPQSASHVPARPGWPTTDASRDVCIWRQISREDMNQMIRVWGFIFCNCVM